MPDRMSQHHDRGLATQAAIRELPPVANLPEEVVTVHAAMITEQEGREAELARKEAAWSIKSAQVYQQARKLWRQLVSWYAVARVIVPANLQAALDQVDTTSGFSPAHTHKRAVQTQAALSQLPEDFIAADLTKAALQAAIAAMLTAFQDEANLEAAFHTAHGDLVAADKDLDQENKRIYKILAAMFSFKGTREYEVVHAIPTTPPKSHDAGQPSPPSNIGPTPAPPATK